MPVIYLKDLQGLSDKLNLECSRLGDKFYTQSLYNLRGSDKFRLETIKLFSYKRLLDYIIRYNLFSYPSYLSTSESITRHNQDGTDTVLTRKQRLIKKIGNKYQYRQCDDDGSTVVCTYIYKDVLSHGNCLITDCNLEKMVSQITNYITNINSIQI